MVSFDEFARGVGRLVDTVGIVGRTVGPFDTNPVPREWTHVTKLDPENAKKLPLLYPLFLRHTSAVSVGGSSDVTARNTEETFALLEPLSVPAFHEPSEARHVTERTREAAAFIAIPEVLNGDSESLVGTLGKGTEYIREELTPSMLAEKLPWWTPDRVLDALANVATSLLLSEAVFEAYVIQNPDSAAAREANVEEDDLLAADAAKQHAMAAERHLESELVYLEYSGTYGGDEAADILSAVADSLDWSRLWYGGGLDSREHAQAMLDAGADTVVVGDVFHDVAAEEATLCADARDDLSTDADAETIREWVTDHVDVDDSAAARYLSTVPSVTDPVETAERYLAATVETHLELTRLGELAAEAEPTTRGELRRFVDEQTDGTIPGERHLQGTTRGESTSMARTITVDVLARRLRLDESELPVSHLSTAV
ncbi:phosphoglycerol geranylgeranyltransferase [Halogranum amylolyticum]|uniref:phosphoglycerol geranylgeranyltransferase n=1 Tax=Halogranum amylolyticum TaxID=660520 RepID=A0A1H8SNQ6_9EURY|nr:heptaprenylglyceryl phosphate synthase [Halogranum amylolyticum]SEO79928.1 phosphoglycerol geranylgeranyltransferase [Halogranum amylolyticum]